MSDILTIEQAAEVVPLSTKSLYRVAKTDPASPFRKRAGRWMVVREDLIAWVRDGERGKPCSPVTPMPRSARPKRGSFLAEVNQLQEANR